MEAENVLNLFDSYWYDQNFFKRSKPTKINKIPEIPSSNMNLNHNIPNLPTIHTKSPSLEKMSLNTSKFHEFSASPNSVLQSPKLQTIFSGKETNEFDNSKLEKSTQENDDSKTSKINNSLSSTPMKGNIGISSRRKKKKGLSKSLSDLEFEELKGFMDLGFVFSEEDKDSTLASIIPGLQRLRNHNTNTNTDTNTINNNNNNNNNAINMNTSIVSRPYLSEAWEVLEKRKKKNKENSMLLNWKVPVSTNQIDMKDYLKSWAHNVASTVKL